MPDITMCDDAECPMRNECYRAQAKPSPWQSWFAESPRDGESCAYFWPASG